jgi:6-phosphogluconate dehydrogenase
MVALQNEIQAMMNIGLIGCGMWGRNLARNLAQLEVLAAVADRHAENAAEFGSAFAAKPVDVDTLIMMNQLTALSLPPPRQAMMRLPLPPWPLANIFMWKSHYR